MKVGFHRRLNGSLKARVTLVSLMIFLLAIWTLALFASKILMHDTQRMLGDAQESAVSEVAAQIDDEISARLNALERIASAIDEKQLQIPADLQDFLKTKVVFQSLFSGGSFITEATGVGIASYPGTPSRVGLNFADRDYFVSALRGMTTVGGPVAGKALGHPVLVLATPIRTKTKVVGVLAGVIDLGMPTFFDRISQHTFGARGNYFVVSKKYRLIIASSEKSRVLEVLPRPGINQKLDRVLEGFEGTQVLVNPKGVEVLSSSKTIPTADWFATISTPTSEVYAPLYMIGKKIMGASLILSLIAGYLTWLMLRRELMPLQNTADLLESASQSLTIPALLSIPREDEIGRLSASFNKLFLALAEQQRRLSDSEGLYRTAFLTSPDALALTRLSDGHFIDVNIPYSALMGWSKEEMVGHTATELGIWPNVGDRLNFIETLGKYGHCKINSEVIAKSRLRLPVAISARTLKLGDEFCILSIIQDLTARNVAIQQIQLLESFDLLTGLPNRKRFKEQLAQTMEAAVLQHRHGALVYVDLDDFNILNDTLGHDEGDALLIEVASRIVDCIPTSDAVARIGGDDFALILRDLDPVPEMAATQAESITQEIRSRLAAPYILNQTNHWVSCSIGITLFGEASEQVGEPLKRAELAMYQAKTCGRNHTCFFEQKMQTLVMSRAALERSLREAIVENQFRLHYQPQVERSGRVNGVEALIRWLDPKRGMVPPNEFIGLAESTGLIIPLGQWVLETACKQLATWSGQPAFSHLTIAVNVSSSQFLLDDFVGRVSAALEESGADPRRLKLEMTESMLVTDTEQVLAKMYALKAKGVGFSLDDFGTGYSSLSYLKRLPLDQLKIDQSFVRDLLVETNDLAIAKMIVALGNTLGLNVIAEGVETAEQRDTLAELGCGNYQGYLYGKPMSVDDLETILNHSDGHLTK
ncbi:MAG: EAL domain-containing protein [Bacteroidota bacterium]